MWRCCSPRARRRRRGRTFPARTARARRCRRRSRPSRVGRCAPVPAPTAPAASATAPADPGAEADFRDAKARFDSGAQAEARASLDAFVAHHGQHPFRPAVDLMLARLALLRGDAAAAKGLLEPLVATPPDPGTASSARYYLGIAEVRLGGHARGRELLLPFLPAAGAAGPGDEALVEVRGALAEATAASGDLERGAGAVGRLRARWPRAREGVRARARGRAGGGRRARRGGAHLARVGGEGPGARRAGREGGRVRARAGRIPAAPRRSTPRRRPRATRWASTTRRRRRRDRGTPGGWGWRSR